MKKMMTVTVLVLAMLCIVPSLCLAQSGGWVTANVNSIGVGGTATYIALIDTASPPHFPNGYYFTADTTGVSSKQMLATALTAVSLNKTVLVYLDSYASLGNMSAMYLNQ